ncbi:ABC transporter permease [Kribbella qitaiheensis]|uniref:ABC transporter permease n=1 Tax=Kribbella qitaiheensis TaxID=1544730 RepID=A0A7G6WSU5_9ACTN|nr:ABC transporter permease subunit [Kribbella qitaiheensis]QNE17060.1 ABC transporter permease [Kribbella qitaiheensis]
MIDGPAFQRVLRSEGTKLSSTNWAVLIALPVVFSALSGWIGHTNHARPTDPTLSVGGGFLLFAVAVGVFGLTMMSGEFQSGVIRATFTAVPRRLPVLWAKAVVLVVVATPALLFGYFGAFLTYQAFTDSALRLSLGDPGIVRSLFGAVGATVAAGLMALALGTLLRSTAGALSAYVLVLVVLPSVLLSALPASFQGVLPYFPTLALQGMFRNASEAMVQVGDAPDVMLSPGVSSVVVLGWVILMLAWAAALLRRRDI